ncbi:MAG: hypothetical protein BGO26_00510 [Actinobacteria bacterium 69-20]|nr:FMN-binding protein [Actinomycetota bacterium]OJV26144.1 MAG: hypothetical protein BGO26_00510 [Actinobacteria bacterium 69-20]
MRRITLAIMSTVAALVLLFSYRTSLGVGAVAQPANPAHIVSGAAAAGSGTTSGQGPNPGSASGSAGNAASAAAAQSPSQSQSPSKSATSAAQTPSTTTSSQSTATSPTVADGAVEGTPYGPVQVQVTVAAGRITNVTAIQQPSEERRSQEINAMALPQLQSEVLSAQSSQIDAVSGATYTSEGFVASLQSALDVAHFVR